MIVSDEKPIFLTVLLFDADIRARLEQLCSDAPDAVLDASLRYLGMAALGDFAISDITCVPTHRVALAPERFVTPADW